MKKARNCDILKEMMTVPEKRRIIMNGGVLKRLAVVFFLSLACTVNVWGASRYETDFTYQPYYGTPGHRGEDAVGRMYTRDDGSPKAFYKNGESRQMKKVWLGMDVYEKGTFYGSYWYYFGDSNFVPYRWAEVDGRWYYQTREGAVGGWYEETKGVYYYFDPVERYMWTSGDVERDGQMYTIGHDGIARKASALGYSEGVVSGGGSTGWAEENGSFYFLRDGTRICSEWLQDGADWYYLGADGYVYRGIKEIDGVVYKFADDGRMLVNETGFYKEQKYQFGEDGKGVLIEMTPLERIGHSKVIKWMRGTYAIYTADVEAARMLGANYNEKELLVRDWGIGDRDSGLAMLERLVANARSTSDKDQKAWNYSRAMMLCQTFQNVEFITQEERYAKQLEIAPEIQANFTSWDDFNTHYMNGFREWAYSADRADSVRRREAMYEYQKQRSDSPFLLDWNLKLEKDW